MTPEQLAHMKENMAEFCDNYQRKYEAGQKEHSGNMWRMGLKQALKEAKQEVLDQWSYLRQVEQCVKEIEDCEYHPGDVYEILNRIKKDGSN